MNISNNQIEILRKELLVRLKNIIFTYFLLLYLLLYRYYIFIHFSKVLFIFIAVI
jgi:hypothetical protein